MSTGLQEEKWTKCPSPQSSNGLDRTWKLSNGISFESSKTISWKSSQNLRCSSPQPPSSTFSAQDGNKLKQSYEKDKPPVPATQDGLTISRSQQDEPIYPRPRVSSEVPKKSNAEFGEPNQHQGSHAYEGKVLSQDQPFRTPLGFHIPKAKLEIAKQAEPSSPSAYWQYRLYQGPAGEHDKVKVHYCKNIDDTERVAQLFLDEEVIGLDIEWTMNAVVNDGIRKNVALVQVASERRVALFHLARYPNAHFREDFVAPSFRKLMESSDITKVGVSIRGDCTRLRKHLHIDSRGLLELSHLYKLVKYSTGDVKKINKMLVSLADQVQEHLQLPLWKGEVRSSDWSQDLNFQQTQYAASDSYAGFQLFHVLEAKRKALNPTPPRPAHAELNLPIRLADGHTVATFDEVAETAEDWSEDSYLSSDISVEELARDVEKIMIEDSCIDPTLLASSRPAAASPAPLSTERSVSLPPSPQLHLANDWVTQYKSYNPGQSTAFETRVKPAELRAYALWHEQGLDVPIIAGLLRKPPLQNSTVANYVGRAIQSENLPFMVGRIADLEKYGSAYGVTGVNWKKLKRDAERVGS